MTEAAQRTSDGGVWLVLPQAVSRLSAVVVFAVAARRLNADGLGVLAVATAVTAGSFALAPAVVGKPLAVLQGRDERERRGSMAQSFAVLAAAAAGVALLVGALVTGGAVRTVLWAGAIGVPAAMVVEGAYWRSVFLHGRRRAGLDLSAVYLLQLLVVVVCAAALSDTAVIAAPFVALAMAAVVELARGGGVSVTAARAWAGEHRTTWLPYVYGVGASVALVQAIPIILALTAGLAASSVYRAGELAFGLTNLLIGIVVQTQLTEDRADVGRTYRRSASVLALAAGLNGIALALVPERWLGAVVGPVAGALQDVTPWFTLLRVGLGVASVGGVLLVRVLTARRVGRLGVGSAVLSSACLVVGALSGGLAGGLAGLALAELAIAGYYGSLLRRRT